MTEHEPCSLVCLVTDGVHHTAASLREAALAELVEEVGDVTDKPKKCRLCKQVGGPWPSGDRPKSTNPLQSGCPRCGWCY